ncbi:MAG: hypothetical protein ACRDS1_08490 [Pseudonocardiaceae bacterium]
MNHRFRARDRARNLVYARELAHALARDLGLALARDPTFDRDLTHARTLTHALNEALELNRTLDRSHALDLVHTLARVRARGAYAFDLTHDSTRARAIDRAHNCAIELIRTLDRARDVHVPARHKAVPDAGNSLPGRVPRGVVALATRVLPAWERPRYREEFRAEMVELPRQERLEYALRVLARAWVLRRVLTGVVRNPDGSPARRADR